MGTNFGSSFNHYGRKNCIGGLTRCAGQRPVSEHCGAESDHLFFREYKKMPLKQFRTQNIKELLGFIFWHSL